VGRGEEGKAVGERVVEWVAVKARESSIRRSCLVPDVEGKGGDCAAKRNKKG